MVYPLPNSRLCCNVRLRRKNLSATLQMTLVSHRKRYGVLFVLFIETKRPILEQIYLVATTGEQERHHRTGHLHRLPVWSGCLSATRTGSLLQCVPLRVFATQARCLADIQEDENGYL